MKKKSWMIGILLALGIGWLAVRWANTNTLPQHVPGTEQGELSPCPDSPNCVSTRSNSAEHRIEPIHFTDSTEEAVARLTEIIAAMRGSQIVTANEKYIHAEFRSALLGFVDDVEFQLDESAGLIHFRSASRIGHSDLGVNRKRMEAIRQSFDQQ